MQSQAVEANAKRARTRERDKDLGSSDLPPSWQLFVKSHRSSVSKGKPYKEIFSPEGQRYLSYPAVSSWPPLLLAGLVLMSASHGPDGMNIFEKLHQPMGHHTSTNSCLQLHTFLSHTSGLSSREALDCISTLMARPLSVASALNAIHCSQNVSIQDQCLQARQAWEADGQSPSTPAPGMPGSILQLTLSVADPPPGWDVLIQLPGERGGRSSICWQSKSDRHQKRCWGQVSSPQPS